MATMVAKRAFKYGTRRLSVGDTVEINRRDVRFLRTLKWVEAAPVAPAEDPYPAYEPSEEVLESLGAPKKRAYKRRDMKAEE